MKCNLQRRSWKRLVRNAALRAGTAAALVFVAGVPLSLHGEDMAPDSLPMLDKEVTLNEALRYAALNNAGLEAAFNQWKSSLERVPQSKSLPDPRFSYTYYIEEVETRVGPQRQKFGIAQMFPWFGTLRLRADAASESAAAAEQVYEKTKRSLFNRVKTAYHEYWYLAQAVAVTREHLKLVANLEGVARTRFQTGIAPNSAVIQAQVEYGKLDDRLRSLEALRAPIVARLNAAMNRPIHLPLSWPGPLPEVAASFSDEEARQRLAESNPDLQRLDHLSRKEDLAVRLARKNYYPDLTLGVDYVQTDDALMPGTTDSGKDPVMAMVSISVPLWYGKYRAAEREARLRKAAAEETRDDTGRRLDADLELALYHFRDALRKIELYRETLIPKAEQSLKVAQQGFEAGSTSFITLIDAERQLLEFDLAYRRAQADRGERLAEIEMLTGSELGTRNAERGAQE